MVGGLAIDEDMPRGLVGSAEAVLAQKPHAKIARLIEYWRAVAPEGRLPGRQHFDPAAIPQLLSNIWMLDVEREGGPTGTPRFRYRLIGTSVAHAFGKDLTGRYLDEAHDGFAQSGIHGFLKEVVEKRQPSWRMGRPKFFALRDFLQVERVYLPSARDGENIDMIWAMTIFLNRDGREF